MSSRPSLPLREMPAWSRVGAEEWKADTPEGVALPVGANIKVREVRGTRLVVEPVDA